MIYPLNIMTFHSHSYVSRRVDDILSPSCGFFRAGGTIHPGWIWFGVSQKFRTPLGPMVSHHSNQISKHKYMMITLCSSLFLPQPSYSIRGGCLPATSRALLCSCLGQSGCAGRRVKRKGSISIAACCEFVLMWVCAARF